MSVSLLVINPKSYRAEILQSSFEEEEETCCRGAAAESPAGAVDGLNRVVESEIEGFAGIRKHRSKHQVELSREEANELTRSPEGGNSEAAVPLSSTNGRSQRESAEVPLVTTGVNSATEFTTGVASMPLKGIGFCKGCKGKPQRLANSKSIKFKAAPESTNTMTENDDNEQIKDTDNRNLGCTVLMISRRGQAEIQHFQRNIDNWQGLKDPAHLNIPVRIVIIRITRPGLRVRDNCIPTNNHWREPKSRIYNTLNTEDPQKKALDAPLQLSQLKYLSTFIDLFLWLEKKVEKTTSETLSPSCYPEIKGKVQGSRRMDANDDNKRENLILDESSLLMNAMPSLKFGWRNNLQQMSVPLMNSIRSELEMATTCVLQSGQAQLSETGRSQMDLVHISKNYEYYGTISENQKPRKVA
ncbi:unnamed protein product, partial [Ranitomeya imitator]